jgi:hypothetical protein
MTIRTASIQSVLAIALAAMLAAGCQNQAEPTAGSDSDTAATQTSAPVEPTDAEAAAGEPTDSGSGAGGAAPVGATSAGPVGVYPGPTPTWNADQLAANGPLPGLNQARSQANAAPARGFAS